MEVWGFIALQVVYSDEKWPHPKPLSFQYLPFSAVLAENRLKPI